MILEAIAGLAALSLAAGVGYLGYRKFAPQPKGLVVDHEHQRAIEMAMAEAAQRMGMALVPRYAYWKWSFEHGPDVYKDRTGQWTSLRINGEKTRVFMSGWSKKKGTRRWHTVIYRRTNGGYTSRQLVWEIMNVACKQVHNKWADEGEFWKTTGWRWP